MGLFLAEEAIKIRASGGSFWEAVVFIVLGHAGLLLGVILGWMIYSLATSIM